MSSGDDPCTMPLASGACAVELHSSIANVSEDLPVSHTVSNLSYSGSTHVAPTLFSLGDTFRPQPPSVYSLVRCQTLSVTAGGGSMSSRLPGLTSGSVPSHLLGLTSTQTGGVLITSLLSTSVPTTMSGSPVPVVSQWRKAPPIVPSWRKTQRSDLMTGLERAATWNRWTEEETLMQLAG